MGDYTDLSIYKKLEQEFESKYKRKQRLLKNEIINLKQENEILTQRKNFEYDETVIELRKENLSLIKEYEVRLSKQMAEIKDLRKEIIEEKERKADLTESSSLRQEIGHLKHLLENEKHENKMYLNEIKGLKIREKALILDKKTSIDLINQECKGKIKQSAMKIVLVEEENRSLKKRIGELESLITQGKDFDSESKYRKLYIQEKKNYEEILGLFDQKSKHLKEALKSKNSLEGVTAKINTIALKSNQAMKKVEDQAVSKFLVGLELHRLSMIHDGAMKA